MNEIKLLNLYKREYAIVDVETVKKEVGAGWGSIIERLIPDLFALGWDGEINQVKEKFGTLRFYIGAASDEVRNRVSRAEMESDTTCEECGAPGEIRGGGWIKTLCLTCHENWSEIKRKRDEEWLKAERQKS